MTQIKKDLENSSGLAISDSPINPMHTDGEEIDFNENKQDSKVL